MHNFQNYKEILSFVGDIFEGIIILGEADRDESKLTNKFVKFVNKTKQI